MTQRFTRALSESRGAPRSAELADESGLVRVLDDALEYARRRGYSGPDYTDGMSSRVLRSIPVENKWLNLAVQESVKRAPVNIRPLLLVDGRRNFQGTALFAMANLNRHQLRSRYGPDGETSHVAEARDLVEWLIENRSMGYSGFCGGHNHPIQHLDGLGSPDDPDVVSTSYAVKALLGASDLSDRYAVMAETAADFVVEDLDFRPVEDGAKIDSHLNQGPDYYTLDAGAVGGRLFVDLYDQVGSQKYRDRATDILDHVTSRQTDIGGWFYREPPTTSHLSMNNHHNGFIIESLLRYQDVIGTDRYDETLDRALSFYRNTLFEPSGAPNWDENTAFPRDVHAAAQGMLVFTHAGDLEFARRILEWVLENLYAGDGRFYFRQHRYYTKPITLMRWCQAWMAYAISEYIAAVHGFERATSLQTELDRGQLDDAW